MDSNQSVRIRANLARAIRTMRDACDDAERRAQTGDITAAINVMHALTWGHANATSHIECALSAAADGHEIALFNAHVGD